MCGTYRRDLLQGSPTIRVTNEASSGQFSISVELLSHSERVGLEQDFRNDKVRPYFMLQGLIDGTR